MNDNNKLRIMLEYFVSIIILSTAGLIGLFFFLLVNVFGFLFYAFDYIKMLFSIKNVSNLI
jgi:hypothetical protein